MLEGELHAGEYVLCSCDLRGTRMVIIRLLNTWREISRDMR